MAASSSHWDVGAYVLGALSPQDTTAFEEHLVGCDVCADEVEFLLPTAGRLAGVDAAEAIAAHARTAPDRAAPAAGRSGPSRDFDDLFSPPQLAPPQLSSPLLSPSPVSPPPVSPPPVSPPPGQGGRPSRSGGTGRSALRRAAPRGVVRRTVARDVVRRALAGPAALHRKARATPRHGRLGAPAGGRRSTVLASLLLAVVAALAFAAGSHFSGRGDAIAYGNSPAAAATTTAPASARPAPAEQLEATNPATGVHAILAVTGTSWGSQVELTLGGVRGPLWCELVAIGRDRKSIVVASWTVHSPGYGIPADPELLTIQAATAVTLSGTDHFDIHAIDAHGAESTLVTLLA